MCWVPSSTSGAAARELVESGVSNRASGTEPLDSRWPAGGEARAVDRRRCQGGHLTQTSRRSRVAIRPNSRCRSTIAGQDLETEHLGGSGRGIERTGELDLSGRVRPSELEEGQILASEDVPSRNRVARGRLLGLQLLDETRYRRRSMWSGPLRRAQPSASIFATPTCISATIDRPSR
jgi:hypothetical protein